MLWLPSFGATPFFPLKDVKPGLKGVGKTVFAGGRVVEFQVEILGVIENTSPKQSIVLAKLSGGPLAETGVIQGMSGSPVYIDGKLLGAVALGRILITFAGPLYDVTQQTYRVAFVPEPLMGRVAAAFRAITWATLPIGSLAGGILATTVGIQHAIFIGSSISFCAIMWLAVLGRSQNQPRRSLLDALANRAFARTRA